MHQNKLSRVLQIPQPSDDPNDPLNWPLWRRDLITFLLCFAAILATALGPILAANTIVISRWFEQDLTDVAVLTGYFLLGTGGAAIFFVPSARVWGKRHLFLFGICVIIGSSAWAGSVHKNYDSFVGARVVQGIGTAPFESLINAAVGDLYFLHQRGVRMAFTNLAVFGGAFFTPIVVGKITSILGWNWTFYFVSIFMAATLPAVFLLCPETSYRREDHLNTDTATDDAKLKSSGAVLDSPPSEETPAVRRHFFALRDLTDLQPIGKASSPRKTFLHSLSLFDGRKTNDRYSTLILRPFPLLANPAFLWACLVQGTMIGWTVFIGVLIAAVFIGPPYWWGEVESGYTYTAPCIGAICGFLTAGFLADRSVRFLTKRNNGTYEPEFRILLVIPMFIVGSVGLFGFGITASNVVSGQYPYEVPLAFFGFEVAGMVIGTVASSLYIVDAYRKSFCVSLTSGGFQRLRTLTGIWQEALQLRASPS